MAINRRYTKQPTAAMFSQATQQAGELEEALAAFSVDVGIDGAVAPIDIYRLARCGEAISRAICAATADMHEMSEQRDAVLHVQAKEKP